MKLKLKEAIKLLNDPGECLINIKEWNGSIILRGISVSEHTKLINRDDSNNIRRDLLISSIISPTIDETNIDIFMKRSFSIIEYIYECCMVLACIHPKMDILLRECLMTNNVMYNKFEIANEMKNTVWSRSNCINDWYVLEYYMHMFYKEVKTIKQNSGAIGEQINRGKGKVSFVKKLI